jgi:hypothetical protein
MQVRGSYSYTVRSWLAFGRIRIRQSASRAEEEPPQAPGRLLMKEQIPEQNVEVLRASFGNPDVPIHSILVLDLTFCGRFYHAKLSSAHLDSPRAFVGKRYE